MKRLSVILADVAEDLDALAGKYHTKESQTPDDGDFTFADLPLSVFYSMAEITLEMGSQAVEYAMAKPVYCLENVLLGKPEQKPFWVSSTRI